ncbi:pleckstrin homology domain-containing family G member 7 [Serinus canaria]|nr:pleckstrin homology domain-containing family G member 7 [Serinus canaria]
MQQPSSDYSPDLLKETCASVEPLDREADLHQEDAPWSETSPQDVFSSSEMQTVAVCMDTTLPPGDYILQQGYTESSLLRLPTEESIGIHHVPFQFDRHARARISTSPTLRRLRMASASQALSFQDCSGTAQLGNQKEYTGSLHHICKSPPRCITISSLSLPSCVHAKLLSSKAKSERTAAVPESDLPSPKLPSREDPLSNDSPNEPPRNSWRANSATLPTRLPRPIPTLWAGVQEALQEFPGTEMTCAVVASRRSAERRRSSLVVSLPGLEVFPGDLLVSDSAMDYLPYSSFLLSAESKKSRWPFAKRGVGKDKQKQASDLESCLSAVKITDLCTDEFFCFKSKSWHEFINEQQTEQKDVNSQLEAKKEAAVWELFTSECTYFLDHLLVLKMIFMNTLKYLQSNEFLLDVDLWRLFANLEELNKISLSFLKMFFETVKKHVSKSASPVDFSSVLRMFFQDDLCQTHQIYCLNYTSAIFYLEKLRQREDFGIYLKWCEQNEQCKRLHLPELLVAPLHRLTRYPLLLNNIWKRSTDETEKSFIQSLKEKVEKSIRDLEGKVKWLDNFQKFRQLQEVIIWPQVWDRDKRFFVPECLKQNLRENSSENILSSANRLLLHEGKLMLAESTRLLDVYLFLFDDFLLITKIKRNKKKYGGSDTSLMPVCPSLTPELQFFIREGGVCTVLDQPIPLDRLILKNVEPIQVTVFSLRNAFLIQHENRYRQCIALFLLQAQTETAKKAWMSQIETAISNYTTQHETKKSTAFCFPVESSEI